jgi:erythromycin esterase
LIHRGHEPLEFRNEVIRYAVTHLGFTAVALESGFTESAVVDSFVHGGAGNVDSVLSAGLNWNFSTLPENRELVQWLREYNAHAAHQVRFYGFDLTGGDPANKADLYLGAPKAISAALTYMTAVAPRSAADFRSGLAPLIPRFTPLRFKEYTPGERRRLTNLLDSLYRTLVTDSAPDVRASSPVAYERAVRNAWNAQRLNQLLAMSASELADSARPRNIFRDSLMAENVRWVAQQHADGRVLVWAHNAHIINAPTTVWELGPNGQVVPVGPEYRMAGQYLREWYGTHEVIVLSTTSKTVGFDGSPSDPDSFDAVLAPIGLSPFVLDLRTSDGLPPVRAQLARPWPFRVHTMFQRIVPREAADAIVYFDQVTATKDQ